MSRAPEKRLVVAGYTEIGLLFIGFLLLLALLFPHDFIRKQVLAESSNYDLTIAYLENMLKRDPKNETLLLALVRAARKDGNIDLGLKLIDTLRTSRNPALRFEALKLRYLMFKQRYMYESESAKRLTREQMKSLLERISAQVKTPGEIVLWYEEALFLNEERLALRLALRYLDSSGTKDPLWLERAYALCTKLACPRREALLDDLIRTDTAHRKKWLAQAYRLAIVKRRYDKAVAYLKAYGKDSVEAKAMAAEAAIGRKHYVEASEIYASLYERKGDATWLKRAVEALLYAHRYDRAAALAKRYESCYYDDASMMQWYLKLYLQTEKVEEAVRLSQHLLKRGERP